MNYQPEHVMVDYNDEAQAKHRRMQEILADLRKQADTGATPPDDLDTARVSDDVAKSDPPATAASPTLLVPSNAIRLAVGADALAIEVLDRMYPQCRATVEHLAPRSSTYLNIYPNPGAVAVAPKAWSFRIRDSHDPHVRRTAMLTEVSCSSVEQMRIAPRVGLETDELEADYYRIALESGKEATLVARDISGFACFAAHFPLQVALFNPHDMRAINILIRVWGEEQRLP